MRPSEIRELVRVQPPRIGRRAALDRCHDIDDLRAAARRVLPRPVFDYVDGGADEETTLAANRDTFRRTRFRPRVLRDVAEPDTSVRLFERRLPMPLGLAPTGYTRMVDAAGEPAVARAAAAHGLPYTLSTVGTSTIEQIAGTGHPDLWFQLYMLADQDRTDALVDRAAEAGYRVLEVAVDAPVAGHRGRDVRNGLTIPPRLTPRALLDIGLRPRYWTGQLRGEPLRVANLTGSGAATVAAINALFDPRVTWQNLERVRRRWPGTLLLKGPLGAADVCRAKESGVDGVHLSNHGGRQLDRGPGPLELLAAARAAAGADYPILLDSGIRHGMDVAAAVALGADACLIGRAYLYGLAAGGGPGVERALDLLTAQFRRTLQLLGVRTIAELRECEVHIDD
ncbi:alpha-hydroxy acid oxidase [Sciscionella sediminilitoris]|uniref:alpha-hydroxy acid oxidase n=1 Tax=Sciscionella sediminilitoris TaxID=1445613 RepID=UPI0004DF4DAD|nr:alpha-hydroxy acid oxidase [Sciscionella sp. SE31]